MENEIIFHTLSELPQPSNTRTGGIPMIVRIELVSGGIHRDSTVGYRIVEYNGTMNYKQYFYGLPKGEVVTHWALLPIMEQDKGKHLCNAWN